MYIKYIKNNSYKNPFFIFHFYNTLTVKLNGKPLAKKTFFSLIKQFLISTRSTKLTILVLLNMLLQYFI